MSGTRRTEDFNTVKARQIILQNPDGSFPPQGQLLGITDGRGTVGPTPTAALDSLTVNHLTVTTPLVQNTINALNIVTDDVTTYTLEVGGSMTAQDICANNVVTVYLTAEIADISCANVQNLYVTSEFADSIQTSSIVSGTGTFTNIFTDNINIAGAITVPTLVAQDISAEHAAFGDMTATTGIIQYLQSTDISVNTVSAVDMTVTGNFLVTGSFQLTDVSTNSVITNSLVANTVDSIVGTFDTLNVTTFNVTSLSFTDLSLNTLTANNVITQALTVTGLSHLADVSAGAVIATSLTATGDISGTNIFGSSITSLGNATIVGDLSANNLYGAVSVNAPEVNADTVNASNQITILNPAEPPSAVAPFNPGILTYDISRGLLVNGLAVSSSLALTQQPFSLAPIYNNCETVADISATLLALVNSYNSFLELLQAQKIIVYLAPVITFSSTCSIQFVISGVVRAPLLLLGTYSITDLVTALNAAVGSSKITFTVSQFPSWYITITVTAPTTNTFIADVTGMPTGSLQVLRYLGYGALPIASNPFECYDLSGTQYYLRRIALTTTPYDSATIPATVAFVNNMPTPTYTISGDPYSLPITVTNLAAPVELWAFDVSSTGYSLYPITRTTRTLTNLVPNTGYSFSIIYLDDYNNRTLAVSAATTKIPYPTNIVSLDISFNTFSLTWSQPYPGKTYAFHIDASGHDISGEDISGTGVTFFPLDQNSTYILTLYSIDTQYNSLSNPSPPIIVQTTALLVPTPVITDISNSNITKLATWSTVPAGAFGTFNYDISGILSSSYSIPGGVTSFTLTDLSGAGDISASLFYTDNYYNNLYGGVVRYHYDASFGFYDLSANALPGDRLVLDGVTTRGIGYKLPTSVGGGSLNSPWLSYTVNRILFSKGITEISGNSVTFVANLYTVERTAVSNLYNASAGYTVTGFDLSGGYGPPIATSSSYTLGANTTAYPTLAFSSPVIINKNSMIMFEKTGGTGAIRFATFDLNASPNIGIAKIAYATPLLYSGSTLVNTSAAVDVGAICQFNYV